MHIILVGANGRLGTAFERLLKHHTFLTPSRSDLDLVNRATVFSYIEAHPADVLINCAAYNNVDAAEINPATAFLINAHGTQFLAEASAKFGMPFIHFSTDYEFDGNKQDGYSESDAASPISQYGMSKVAGTQRAIAACPNAYVIRTSRLYGSPGREPESKKSFVEIVLELADKGEPFTINRAEVSAPTFVDDLVQHIEQYILSPISNKIASSFAPLTPRNDNFSNIQPARTTDVVQSGGPPTSNPPERLMSFSRAGLQPGIYHMSNAGGCSWLEWAQAIVELSGKNVPVLPRDPNKQPRPAKRPAHSVLRSTKLPPMRPWKEALAAYLGSTENNSVIARSHRMERRLPACPVEDWAAGSNPLEKIASPALREGRGRNDSYIPTGIDGCVIEPQPLFGTETAGVLHMLSGGEKNPRWFPAKNGSERSPVLDIYSCFTTEPFSSRGGHYHHKQDEMFLPYNGSVLFLLIDFRPESATYGKTASVIIGWDTPKETHGIPCHTFKKDGMMPRLRVPVGVYHALFSLETGFTVVAIGSWPYEKDDYVYPDLTPEAQRILGLFHLPPPTISQSSSRSQNTNPTTDTRSPASTNNSLPDPQCAKSYIP